MDVQLCICYEYFIYPPPSPRFTGGGERGLQTSVLSSLPFFSLLYLPPLSPPLPVTPLSPPRFSPTFYSLYTLLSYLSFSLLITPSATLFARSVLLPAMLLPGLCRMSPVLTSRLSVLGLFPFRPPAPRRVTFCSRSTRSCARVYYLTCARTVQFTVG